MVSVLGSFPNNNSASASMDEGVCVQFVLSGTGAWIPSALRGRIKIYTIVTKSKLVHIALHLQMVA